MDVSIHSLNLSISSPHNKLTCEGKKQIQKNSPSPWTDVICLPSRNKSILERYGEGPLSMTTSLRTRRFVGGFPLVTSSFFLMMIHLSLLRKVRAACPIININIVLQVIITAYNHDSIHHKINVYTIFLSG